MRLHLDFETYCELDIKKVGADAYLRHPSAELLLTSWALDDGEVITEEGEEPKLLREFLLNALVFHHHPGLLIYAFNAPFERQVMMHLMDWPLAPRYFRCVKAWAWSLGFVGDLREVGKQMHLPEGELKFDTGRKLILRFCKPQPKNHKVRRWTSENYPEGWESFKGYNVQDVTSERAILHHLEPYPLPDIEWETFEMDQEVNARGLPIDPELVEKAITIRDEKVEELHKELALRTQLENPNSRDQLLGWLLRQGVRLPNLQAETVTNILKSNVPPEVRHVLELRQFTAKTSGSKWEALKRCTDWGEEDIFGNLAERGWFRNAFEFMGAQRTWRWAGRMVQVHNLPRTVLDMIAMLNSIRLGEYQLLDAFPGGTMNVLSQAVRGAIAAPEGYTFAVGDLASIESRLLGWLSGCTRMNNVFATGGDTYVDFASGWFHVKPEEVTKEQRTLSKPPVLGCGYQLGGPGLVRYAESMGVTMSEENGNSAVKLWREMYWEVPNMWEWFKDACLDCISNWREHSGYAVRIHRDRNFLFIDLPSGRRLSYFEPEIAANQWGYPAPSYMGQNQHTHQWERITTHGGKITENIIQALARDILRDAMLQMWRAGLLLVGHIHDEAIALALLSKAQEVLDMMLHWLSQTPWWAPGLVLGAEGFIAPNYKKG